MGRREIKGKNMQCNMQHATCNMQYMQHATCSAIEVRKIGILLFINIVLPFVVNKKLNKNNVKE